MIVIPLFNSLKVEDYGLFPGQDQSRSVTVDFLHGLTLIAGVNGLGKTTLLTMLLRCLSGPFDLTGSGAPEEYKAILPVRPRPLNRAAKQFFSQRVSDGAKNAVATLNLSFGGTEITIGRKLDTLELVEFTMKEPSQKRKRASSNSEAFFQKKMTNLFQLSSFQNVLLVLHNLIFFTENKNGALWDPNAQRLLLSAVLLDKQVSLDIDKFGLELNGADSRFRNTRSQRNSLKEELDAAIVKDQKAPATRKTLEATLSAISGLEEKNRKLEKKLNKANLWRSETVLKLEQAKQNEESSRGAVERAKYTTLTNSFPNMDSAATLMLAKLLSGAECLVCGADAEAKQKEIEHLLNKGCCPICEATPEDQKFNAPAKAFEKVKLTKLVKKSQAAEEELVAARTQHELSISEHKKRLKKLQEVRDELSVQKGKMETLSMSLPPDSNLIKNQKDTVKGLEKIMEKQNAELQLAIERYSSKLEQVRDNINRSSKKLSDNFGEYIKKLFSEDARLERIASKANMGQMKDSKFDFPRFVTSMTAADRSDYSNRFRRSDVSESQRELVDLAFRLALFDVVTSNGEATFVMETPEASLDGLAMSQVGEALSEFSLSKGKRLIVTNNLTNTGMVTALFGGKIKSSGRAKEEASRRLRTFNLLLEAAPNRAVQQRKNDYQKLLNEAILG